MRENQTIRRLVGLMAVLVGSVACASDRPAAIERLGRETRTVPIDAPGTDGLAVVSEIIDGDTIVVDGGMRSGRG